MDDRAFIRDLEGFHNRWFLTLAAVGLFVLAVLATIVVSGFRDNHVYRSADAVTLVHPSPPQVSAAPPASPAR